MLQTRKEVDEKLGEFQKDIKSLLEKYDFDTAVIGLHYYAVEGDKVLPMIAYVGAGDSTRFASTAAWLYGYMIGGMDRVMDYAKEDGYNHRKEL